MVQKARYLKASLLVSCLTFALAYSTISTSQKSASLPELVSFEPPEYPLTWMRTGESASLTLKLKTGTNGTIAEAIVSEIVFDNGIPANFETLLASLNKEVERARLKWRVPPRTLPGIIITKRIRFANSANAVDSASTAGGRSAQAAQSDSQNRFDLICTSQSTYSPLGKYETHRWTETRRYRIDISEKKYCWDDCQYSIDIPAVDETSIVLHYENSADVRSGTTVSRIDGRLSGYMTAEDALGRTEGTCERVAFSGFPVVKRKF